MSDFMNPVGLESGYDAAWEIQAALLAHMDLVDGSLIGWSAVQLPGMPACSLAFVLEHLSAELERILEGEK